MTARERRYIEYRKLHKFFYRIFIKQRSRLGVKYKLHYIMHGPWLAQDYSWKRLDAAPTISIDRVKGQSRRLLNVYKDKAKRKAPYRTKIGR